jgi:lipopolysaccharide/colanic/teichoic acid biosynthesis glycosyltransferase
LSARELAVRRFVDVVAALIGLVLAAPLLACAAVAIKLTSRGPVLFRQERIGRRGRPFELYKLRTMRRDADAQKSELAAMYGCGVRFKLARDPRITAVGRFLRKYSVDELPQLWNLLRGEMTLIGPRPLVRREVQLFDARALRRLEVLPGLTCLWQVSGRSDLPLQRQIDLDLEYIDRGSLVGELWILLRTVPAVLSGKGAY